MNLNEQLTYDKLQKFKGRSWKWVDKSMKKTWVNVENALNPSQTITVPPEALITLWDYQIISQEWLSKQAPLPEFFEEWQKLNPSIDQTDKTKRQCWLDDGIYRYNELWSDWMLKQLGANTPEYDTLLGLYKIATGEDNREKMQSMWVKSTGWRNADDGRVEGVDFAYLRSRSPGGYGFMLAAELHPGRSDVDKSWFRSRAGIVPFGIMDKKVSA